MDNSWIVGLFYLRMYNLSGPLNFNITLSEQFLLWSSPWELKDKGQKIVLIFLT